MPGLYAFFLFSHSILKLVFTDGEIFMWKKKKCTLLIKIEHVLKFFFEILYWERMHLYIFANENNFNLILKIIFSNNYLLCILLKKYSEIWS